MPKKILEITGSLNCAGIETLLVNVLRKIDRSKFNIDFLVVADKKYFYTDDVLKCGSKIYTYPFKKVYKFLIPFFFLKEIFVLLQNKYDAVHCHFYFSSGIVLFLAWLCGVKKRIVHSHNEREMFAPKPLKKIFTKIMQQIIDVFATEKIACSQKAGIALYGKDSKFKIINNGIDVSKFEYDIKIRNKIRKEFNIENNFVIGHIGRFDEQKNHIFLIDVFNEILKYKKNALLLLIGDGILKDKIKGKVNSLKIEEKVRFLSARSDVNEIYQAMDIFLFPSKYEGLGIVAIEAQCSGLPCFISDCIPKEVIVCNTTTISLNKSANEWANIILEKTKDFKRADTSEQIINSGYDFDNTINSFAKIYE